MPLSRKKATRKKMPLKIAKEKAANIRRQFSERYHKAGLGFMLRAIEWAKNEGKISNELALSLKQKVESRQAHDFLTSFGAHLVLAGIPALTIGLGSIARPSYTAVLRLRAAYKRYVRKKITAEEYKRIVALHSVEAIVIGAIPIFGGSAYIISNFVRDPDLMNVLTNYLAYKTFGRGLYKGLNLSFAIEKVTIGAKKYFAIKAHIGNQVKSFYRMIKK
ncbi:MAG: hypothetical protein QW400_04625 [Candidatus Diapherotrites archaeon]